MPTIQATRLKKGMLVKMDQDLFRVLELQHVTPGNLRGFVRVKLRNIRSGTLSDQKLRSEDSVERATLDEREMQYLYQDGDDYYFMDTSSYEQIHISAEALGESARFDQDHVVEWRDAEREVRHRDPGALDRVASFSDETFDSMAPGHTLASVTAPRLLGRVDRASTTRPFVRAVARDTLLLSTRMNV